MLKKKILILGAGTGQVSLIERANESGWYTIVASPQGDYPGFKLASECCYVDIGDKHQVFDIAVEKKIDAIATDQTDLSVSAVDYVAKKLNLPHVLCNDINNFRYKYRMRELCKANALPSIPYCVVTEPHDALIFYKTLKDSAVIVKPIDSQGSRGVVKVENEQELSNALFEALKFSKQKKVIIEQFIEGREVEVDSVVKNGNVICTLIGDVYNFKTENVFSAYERLYPSNLPIETKEKIVALNSLTLSALGMITGWTHGEYIVTDEGDVYLLEVGARGGGNFIGSDIIRTFWGYGTDEMAFRTAIGDDSFYEAIKPIDVYSAYKCFCLPEGIVQAIDIDDDLLNQKFVLKHNLNYLYVGKHIRKNTDKTSRNTIVVKASSICELIKILDKIEKKIHITVLTSAGLREAIWK